MTTTPYAVTVTPPGGARTVVDFTDGQGHRPSVYSEPDGANTGRGVARLVSLPAVIDTPRTFYFADTGPYSLSAKIDGVEQHGAAVTPSVGGTAVTPQGVGPAGGAVLSFDARTGQVTLTKADVVATGLAAVDVGAAAVLLGASNGSDDTAWMNAVLAVAAGKVRATPGQTYKLSGPLIPPSGLTLDMTGATMVFANTAVRDNMLKNAAAVPAASSTDVATTAGSSVITSPALVAAGAAVGMRVGVEGAGPTGGNGQGPVGRLWMYGTIQSVSGNTITLSGNVNGVAASVTLANAVGHLYSSRDRNITVIGGTWNPGTNWNVLADRYNAAWKSNIMLFRRCDGVTVRDALFQIDSGYQSSGDGWVFGVAPGDCTDVLVDHCGTPEGAAGATIFNSSGLISRAEVRNSFGQTYDDMVAFGTVGASFDDIEGDITDVVIDGVFSNGSNRCVDLYCGQGANGAQRFLSNATVRSMKGTVTGNAPVQITNYAGNAQITAALADITAFKPGSGGAPVFVPSGQPGIVVTGPNAGADLAVASSTANMTTGVSGQAADLTNLSVTFNAPPSGQVWLELFAYCIQQGAAAGNIIVYITDNANTVKAQGFVGNIAVSGLSPSPVCKVKVTGLTPGTQYTYKARASTAGTGAATVLAAATFPASLRASAAA